MGYPEISLAHLRTITDCTGVIQHAIHSVPNRKLGYTTDDNARALIVATKQYEYTNAREDLDLAITYLSYLHHVQNSDHNFRNLMTFSREFLDEVGTEDSYGRAMWGCGYAASSGLPENIRVVAAKLFDDGIVWAGDLQSPRARAYVMLGMYYYLKRNKEKGDLPSKIDALADSLIVGLKAYSTKNWKWYEPYLTYGNAILPLGMLVAAEVTGRSVYQKAASETIEFLTDTLVINDRLEVIGNDGWCMRDGKRSWYDQQTIDTGYTVYLYAEAYKLLGDKKYLDLAHIAHSWFFGNNRSEVWVYDPQTAGCFDAIAPWGLNLNQGAESIICFLLAQLAMREILDK